MLWGLPYETIYLYILIGCGLLSILLFFIGDIFSLNGPFDPVVIVPWFACIALVGFIGESRTTFTSKWIFLVAVVLSTLIVFLLYYYVIMPLKSAEATISASEKDLEGIVATVTIPIPLKGMGEINITSVTGGISRPAALYEKEDIKSTSISTGSQVLIVEIKDRVAYVVPYQENFS